MGRTIVEMVVDALNTWGIRADRACPGTWMPEIGTVAAAVQLMQLDQKKKTAQVLISVLVPADRGAAGAEDSALAVCQWMNTLGGVCQQKKAVYLPGPDWFCAEVYAEFAGRETANGWMAETQETFCVEINSAVIPDAVSFKANRETDDEIIAIENSVWHFCLEEHMEVGATEVSVPVADFTIQVRRGNRTEIFRGCTLTGQSREMTPDGLRQIREGTATQMQIQ